MDPWIKERLVTATLRFRKTDMCLLPQGSIQHRELVVMGSICANASCTPCNLNAGDICEKLCITKPAISQSLNALEKKGYITRTIDKTDRRKISVSATPSGLAVLQETWRYYDDAVETLVNRFGPEKTKTLVELLDEFTDLCEKIQNGE